MQLHDEIAQHQKVVHGPRSILRYAILTVRAVTLNRSIAK